MPQTLLETIETLAETAPEEGLSIRALLDALDEGAFGAGLFLLALPCCIPVLYGIPQLVALPMLALAAQMVMGRERPWLPAALADRVISRAGLTSIATGGRKWLGWVEAIVHPRLSFLTARAMERVVGLFFCLFCASILVPLPLTNTVPGFAVAIAAFGLLSRDGLMLLGGLALGTVWVSLLIAAPFLGLQAFNMLAG